MSCRSLPVSRTMIVVSFLVVSPAAAQPSSLSGATTEVGGLVEEGDAAVVPQTPWGHPDLQGVWNTSTTTPLERMTDEERERGRLASAAVAAVTGATSAAWLEQAGGLEREALIVDPPDGRISMTPAATQRLVDRENARRGRRRGRLLARPQLLGALHLDDLADRDDAHLLQRELSDSCRRRRTSRS